MIALDIFSDPICPWCHIGRAHLETAIARQGRNPFTPRWRMFRLNPDMPASGMDRRAYLEAKFGGPAGAADVYGRIEKAAEAAGLDVNFAAIQRTPNTLDAHRLVRWAEAEGTADAAAQQLFHRYFKRGQDISDHDVLLEIATSVRLDPDVTARLLDGDSERAALEAEEAQAREMGISGVPCFIIDGTYVLQGAQPPEAWGRIISEIDAAIAAKRGGHEQPAPKGELPC